MCVCACVCVRVCVCVCKWRKGGRSCRFRGQAPVWDTCSMECWEKTKQMGAPCCCVADWFSLSLTLSHSHTHTHTHTHTLTLPSPISEHKVWGPSCVTEMKQAKTTLSEPGTTYGGDAHKSERASQGCEMSPAPRRKWGSVLSVQQLQG